MLQVCIDLSKKCTVYVNNYLLTYIVHSLGKNNKIYKMNGAYSMKIADSRVAQGKYRLAM
jgi:hypothetical protein